MKEPDQAVFTCPSVHEINVYTHSIMGELPIECQEQLRAIFLNYMLNYGSAGAYQRMNGRTVSQIIADYQSKEPKVVARGEIDGIGYTLFETPSTDSKADGDCQDG